MSDVLVTVDHVSKKFCRSLRRSLWYGLRDLGRELSGLPHGGDGTLRRDEFWAVRDVGFQLQRGECVGLIGHNGSGKTTLLRMLNGLIKPDAGRIELRGRVGALIALGAGFNPLLTGRENIQVNASLLGIGREELARHFDSIVEFSGLSDFIDSPVKHYSSGMYVRLGFSIAVHVHPDILLVDEALAVGDIAFVTRCLNKIAELRRNGTGVIFVSHSELQVRAAAQRCLVLSHGQLLGDCGVEEGFYLYSQLRTAQSINPSAEGFVHDGPVSLAACAIEVPPGLSGATCGEPVRLMIVCESSGEFPGSSLEIRIWNADGLVATSINSRAQGQPVDLRTGNNRFNVDIRTLALVPGRYRIAAGFRREGEVLGWSRNLLQFDVSRPLRMEASEGVFIMPATIRVAGPAEETAAS